MVLMEIKTMQEFLENEMDQVKAGHVDTDVIQLKLGEIEDQVVRLLEKVCNAC